MFVLFCQPFVRKLRSSTTKTINTKARGLMVAGVEVLFCTDAHGAKSSGLTHQGRIVGAKSVWMSIITRANSDWMETGIKTKSD